MPFVHLLVMEMKMASQVMSTSYLVFCYLTRTLFQCYPVISMEVVIRPIFGIKDFKFSLLSTFLKNSVSYELRR